MPVMPHVCLGRVWAGELVMDWAPPDWSLKVKLWSLIGWPGLTSEHTSGGYIPWSPGHRLSSLSTTLPSGDCVLCHLDRCIPCVPSPWTGVSSQHTLLMVKRWYKKWRHQLVLNQILFQDWKRYFGLWMKHQNRLSQVSSSCIFLISTDRFSPGGRGWGELGAEAHNWIMNFKQSILLNLSVIHPVKKSKIWINMNK